MNPEGSSESDWTPVSPDGGPLASAADIALREILEPSGVDSVPATESDVVNALVLAARAVGFVPHPARVAQVGRDRGTDLATAARRLGVPIREVVLDPGWWSGDSGPYIVERQDGRIGAAIAGGGSNLLVLDSRTTRIDERIAATLSTRAWTVTPRLPDQPTGLRQLGASSIGPGSRSDIALALLAAVGTAALGIAAPVLSGYVVGGLVELGTGVRTVAIGILLVMVAICATGLALLESILLQRVATRLNARAVAALLDRLVRLPLSFFRSTSVGSLVQRILGLDQISSTITSSLLRIASGLLLAAAGVVVMVVVSPALAAQVCLILGLFGIAVVVILIHQARARERYVAQALKLSGTTLSLFSGISKIRVTGAEARMQALWTLTYARQQYAARDAARGVQWLSLVAAMAPILVTLTVVIGSVRQSDPLSLGAFTAFVAAASQTAVALASLLGPLFVCIGALPILRAVRPVLAAEPEPQGLAAADPDLHGGVELADVSFRYEENGPNILSNVSLRIPPGQFVAIVGPSGSGKSTLLRVLIGLERPTSGEVLFDGRPLDRLGANLVRRQIGAVAQSAQLASGTILDNIIGASALTEADAWAAAELAGIADDIRAMPMGMRTFVSDGAASFSGGQKQRILLARALVREPEILLLDEATSALDNRTQSAIAEGMRSLGATRIVVAQRLNTIRLADCIYVLDGGSIVEHGTFDELMGREGAFRALALRQLSDSAG